jgi:beta-phosphoglucomutase-like phosphatase (HAD superfamily)
VLDRAGLTAQFRVTLSTEEVGRGKPAPDVYLKAAGRLGVSADRCAGVEDSTNGLRALVAAGMRIVAVPNREFPPAADALAHADVVISNLNDLSADVIEKL